MVFRFWVNIAACSCDVHKVKGCLGRAGVRAVQFVLVGLAFSQNNCEFSMQFPHAPL